MSYNEIVENYINGNLRDAVYEIKHNFGWYDFVGYLENDELLSSDEKLNMLIRLIRVGLV